MKIEKSVQSIFFFLNIWS